MRQLTKNQKHYLDNLDYKPEHWDDLLACDIDVLEGMKDTEILWAQVSRYLSDKRVEEKYVKREVNRHEINDKRDRGKDAEALCKRKEEA